MKSLFLVPRLSPKRSRRRLVALAPVLLLCSAIQVCGQTYTSIVVFGDSLSDTGNDAVVSRMKNTVNAQVPGPATGYTSGRFTDGQDTIPAAQTYTGVWVEQVAAQLRPPPVVVNSLSGGTNYAYGFATTDVGISLFTYGPGNALSFTVNNMGQQVTDYLATNPKIDNKTLFIVWGGANDLINAQTSADIVNAATRDVGIIQRLINAGATDFVIPNLPPLGLVPRFNGSPATSAPATAAALGYNQALGAALGQLGLANAGKPIHIYSLDIATLFNSIVANQSNFGFSNVTASSQGNTAVNPDMYLFWDDLHPTTAGHHLIAASALRLLGTGVGTATTISSSNINPNLNSPVTFTAVVSNNSGGTDTPIGNVTFVDGAGGLLGTGFLTGSGRTASATFTTSALGAGTHPVEATYSSVNGFGTSASAFVNEIVTAPSFSVAVSPMTQTVNRGNSGSAMLTITPAGGYAGSFQVGCGTLSADFSCSVASPNLSVTTASPVGTTVTFRTTSVAANEIRSLRGTGTDPTLFAILGLPMFGVTVLAGRRRRFWPLLLTTGLFVVTLGALLGAAGCGSAPNPLANAAPSGTYQIPLTVTSTTAGATTVTFTVIIQ